MAIIEEMTSSSTVGNLSKACMAGIAAEMQPNEFSAVLSSSVQKPPAAGRTRSHWHYVERPEGLGISITSDSDEKTILRLTVTSDSPGWRPYWAKWSYSKRYAPELQGGSAIDAQDVLSEDRSELRILVMPGETRRALLQFDTPLTDDSVAGRYLFDVVVSDATTEIRDDRCTLTGMLVVEHRQSKLLNMLPAIYRNAPADFDMDGYPQPPFLGRFLSGFEDFIQPMNDVLENAYRLFGPYSTPSDFIPWLSSWVAVLLDENWPEMRRRKLIAESVKLYQWRGTRRGISRYLELYTGVRPEIDDQPFEGMRLGPKTKLGEDTILGDISDHSFVVSLAVPDEGWINEQVIRDIIEAEKPAHTGYALRVVRRAASD